MTDIPRTSQGRASPEDEIGFFSFLGIYLASLSAIVLASWAAHRHFDWPMLRTLMGLAAVQFPPAAASWSHRCLPAAEQNLPIALALLAAMGVPAASDAEVESSLAAAAANRG